MLDKPQLKSMLDTPVAQRMPREIVAASPHPFLSRTRTGMILAP